MQAEIPQLDGMRWSVNQIEPAYLEQDPGRSHSDIEHIQSFSLIAPYGPSHFTKHVQRRELDKETIQHQYNQGWQAIVCR